MLKKLFVAVLCLQLVLGQASATFSAGTHLDVRSGGDDTNNGGGFDTGITSFPTDGAATSATTASPVFTSASYTFVAGDVSAWIFIKSGTNWLPGFYQIASVSAGAATLTAGLGTSLTFTFGQLAPLNTVVGVATTSSPTSATWGIDYSQSTTSRIAFTDMVIGGTTTQFTSAGNPVGKNYIGNIISITSGTGFTVQRAVVISTVTTTATCDRSLGTGGSTGGNGGLGGALAGIVKAFSITVNTSVIHLKASTFSFSSAISGPSAGFALRGFSSVHGDLQADLTTSRPLITTATNSIHLVDLGSAGGSTDIYVESVNFSNTATTRDYGLVAFANNISLYVMNSSLDGFKYAINGENSTWFSFSAVGLFSVEVKNSTTQGVLNQNPVTAWNSNFHDNVGAAIYETANNQVVQAYNCFLVKNTYGVRFSTNSMAQFLNNTIAGNTNHGVYWDNGSATNMFRGLWSKNVVYGNGGFGVDQESSSSGTFAQFVLNLTNAYGANTSGDTKHWQKSTSDLAITTDPFSNSAGGDYSLNNAVGGGKILKAGGFGAVPGAVMINYPDIGANQSPATAGTRAFATSQ